MFGPDMCGVDHKYHFIIRYRNPKTKVYSEHQAKKPTEALDTYFTDKKSHLYTLGRDFLLIIFSMFGGFV
jgi:calnexin